MLAAGTILGGKYEIRRPLESGGMGDVYEAVQKDLARPVAIKLLRAELADDPSLFLRFQREAETSAALGHPNIVQILDFSREQGGEPFIVMEKLEGQSLRQLLEKEGTLAPSRAAFIALQILSALAAAHRAKIVHRDIKPGNVFITKTLAVHDFVKVLDFGIAKTEGPALTDLGQVLGTTSYMAPEQAKGITVDGRADLFAVGGILFQAITGRRPRTPTNLVDVGRMPCTRVNEVAPFVDPRLASIIDCALLLDRDQRFPDAEAMVTALEPFAGSTPSAPAPMPVMMVAPPRVSRTSMPMRVPAATRWSPLYYLPPVLVAILFALGFGGFMLLGYQTSTADDALLATKPPACRAPSTCSGHVTISNKRYGYCVGAAPRVGDPVLVMRSSHIRPGVVDEIETDGSFRIRSGSGTSSIPKESVFGAYCSAP